MSDADERPESSEELGDLPEIDGIVIAPYDGDVEDDEGPVGEGPIIDEDDEPAENSGDDEGDVVPTKEKEESPPPRKKAPVRAPPVPPPRACEIPKDTWSSKPTSNRVWEVEEEEEYDEEQQEPEYDLSETDLAKDYNIEQELGRGFFAITKLVTEKKTGDKYAAKVIEKSMAPQFGAKLKSELDILSKLEHSNILKGKQVYETDSHLLVVLELAQGGELPQVLGKSPNTPYTEEDAHRIAKQLVSALDHIHSKGVIHGDLAPENVLFSGDEKSDIKVGGFSGAVIASGDTENQQMIGNSEFQAPEIIMNQGFDKSADLWSLGCFLYFLIEGESPFADSNTMRMNMKIRQGKFEFGDNWKDISTSLKDLISSLIKVNASERASASDCLSNSWVSGSPKTSPLPNARKNMLGN